MAHPQKIYVCKDCELTFTIRKKLVAKKTIFCPFCGDDVAVQLKGKQDQHWTKHEIKKLVTMYYQGHRAMEIASELKRTYQSIKHRITQLKKDGVIVLEEKKCEICGDKHAAKGYCNRHYLQWKRGTLNQI